MSQPSLTPAQKRFPTTFSSLSQIEQDILKCLSVIYQRVSRTNLVNCLNAAHYLNHQGKRHNNTDLGIYLKNLEEQNLVELTSQGTCCHPEIVELVSRESVRENSFATLANVVQEHLPLQERWGGSVWYNQYNQGIREIRIALYTGQNSETFLNVLTSVRDQYPHDVTKDSPIDRIFFNPVDQDLLHSLPTLVVEKLFIPKISAAIMLLQPTDLLIEFIKDYADKNQIENDSFQSILAFHSICRGDVDSPLAAADSWVHSSKMLSYRGWLAFLQGNTEESLHWYRQGLELLKKETGKRKVCFDNIPGFFFSVALLQAGGNDNFQEALDYVQRLKSQKDNFMSNSICNDMEQTLLLSLGRKNLAGKLFHSVNMQTYYDYFSAIIGFFTLSWQGEKPAQRTLEILKLLRQRAEENGYHWFTKEASAVLVDNNYIPDVDRKPYEKLKALCLLPDIHCAIQQQPKWEKVLEALTHLNNDPNKANKGSSERLVWLIDFDDDYYDCGIAPRLQKLGKNGKWTKGRAVALSTLFKNVNTQPYLTEQDKRIVGAIQTSHESSWGYYGGTTSYNIQESQALPALVDHPLLFWENHPTTQIELVLGSPELHVKKQKNSYKLTLTPEIYEGESYHLSQETPTRLKYIPLTSDYARILEIIGNSVEIPLQAKDKVLGALSQVSKMLTVHSDIGGTSVDAKTVKADARPCIHLLPFNEGIQVEVLCRPFSTGGSYYPPGSGGKTVLAEVDGEPLQTTRNLNLERKNAVSIQDRCPTLNRGEGDGNEWCIDDPETCLELLCELQELGDTAIVEWPKGESLQVTTVASFSQFSMGIKKDNDWFSATGSLKVDDKLTLDMKKLLALTLNSQNRFVQLDDGRFLALSKAFKKRIEELKTYSESHGDGIRFSPLAAPALEEFTEAIGNCTTDKHWKKNLKRFQDLNEPELPSTLQATLRDYQQEGFSWLGRLSSLQIGACLADDMGLGKTVQALSAILLRAPSGPTLVVAPTSVMMNWQDEAARFTPTLNVHYFGNGNRQELLDGLAEFDLVICSYGLLQSEAVMLAGVKWQTVVLDEAQAIKNMQTKRSQAAMKLQANFKIITTGTPIENHLGELWNLFRFINPGLLGSFKSFKQKFANPIEKLHDRTAVNHLRKLVQPFILRRMKHAVLQKLPSRTEVTMQVEMSNEEAAMYEAQRQQGYLPSVIGIGQLRLLAMARSSSVSWVET